MFDIDTLWSTSVERFETVGEERATITAAKAGDEEATLRLFRAHIRIMHAHVRQFRAALGLEDARQVAFVGLLAAIQSFDPSKAEELAPMLHGQLLRVLSEAACEATNGYGVPERTLKRFFGILRQTDGDRAAGAVLAPEYGMSRETFNAVAAAIRSGWDAEDGDEAGFYKLPVPDSASARAFEDADDAWMVAKAFTAVNDLETDVVRLAYGFAEYNTVPDAEIGDRLGMSRLKTLRTRHGALDKMSAALGAKVDSRDRV